VTDTTSALGAGSGGSNSNGNSDSGAVAPIAQTAQEKAGQGATVVTQQASEVTETVKQQAAAVTQEAGTQARQLAAELRDQLGGETRAQGERLVQNLRSLADELRGMGEHGRSDSVATTVVRRLADGGHQVADHLEQRGPGGLLDEVQDFARRRPGLFLAGAALAGFAVARTGKDVASGSAGSGDGGHVNGTSAPVPVPAEGEVAPVPVVPPPAAPLPEAAALAEATTTYGRYGEPEPPPATRPIPDTTPAVPPSPGATEQWSQADLGR
jgi:hypothetical protein